MSDRTYRMVVFGAMGVLMIIILQFRFGYSLEAPEPPPSTSEMYGEVLTGPGTEVAKKPKKFDAHLYSQHLAQDSEKYGIIPAANPTSMSRPFPYAHDTTERELVPGGEPVDVAGLRISLELTDLPNTAFRQFDLQVENLRSIPVAYNIKTRPSVNTKICYRKHDIPHNAVVIKARGTETRSECVWRDGWTLTLIEVEVMEVNDLAHAYLSALTPTRLSIDPRTARGHRAPYKDQQLCNVVHSAVVEAAREKGDVKWRDLVDFYARHRCDTYAFSETYRAIEKAGSVQLPYVR